MDQLYRQIKEIIDKNNNFLLVTHDRPDGDAAGSVCALGEYLKILGKSWGIACADPVDAKYSYLPHSHTWISSVPSQSEVIFFLDIAAPKQTSLFEKVSLLENVITINIDHHLSNEKFAQINFVDINASSTCEVLYNFFHWNKVEINSAISTALMTGILTDSSNLTNAATKPTTFTSLAELMNKQAMLPKLSKQVETKFSLGNLSLWGKALERLKINPKLNLAFTYVSKKDFEQTKQPREALSGLTNYLQNINDVAFTLLLVEEDNGEIKGSFRTNRNDIDVSKIAAQFGGGGHKQAAGFKIKGEIRNIDTQIINKISNIK